MRATTSLISAILASGCLAVLASSPAGGETATLLRDDWGIPHIFATTAEGAVYAHGWAQAEDRLDDLLLAYRAAEGRAAAVLGDARIERDIDARIARHAEIARERYAELAPDTRRLIEYFIAGVQAYMKAHPEEVPGWARLPEPPDVVAHYRAFTWPWTWRQARADLRRDPDPGDRGSNAWIVGPSRTADGAPIALIDPHLAWEPETRFYESGVHGGDLDFYGFTLIGTPWLALGHNAALSLACTTGGPDTADIYELRLHPEDDARYEYDGEWRSIDAEKLTVEVAAPGGHRSIERVIERTHLGPILARQGRRAFAVRTAYDREIGLADQWLRMVRARHVGDLIVALAANQMFPQNLLAADIHGNSYYLRAGRVPRRPPGHSGATPQPGWTAKSEWLGIHPLADLVQMINPPAGFMQNCNVAPSKLTVASPLTADRYLAEIYNSAPERTNSRGDHVLARLASTQGMTVESALELALDTELPDAELWQRALLRAFSRRSAEFAHMGPAVQLLHAWDRRITNDSRGATLYRVFRQHVRDEAATLGIPVTEIEAGRPLAPAGDFALLRALVHAVKWMEERTGNIDAPWGDLHRIRRGGRSWPIAGGHDDGMSTLRSVRFGPADARGVSEAVGGLLCPTVVVLKPGGIESYSATPFGQSNRPDSPFYADQAEKLTSPGKLKRNRLSREEVLAHLSSQRELSVPELP